MKAIVLAASLAACGTKHTVSSEGVDLTRLDTVSPTAGRDLKALINADRSRISRCADPFRPLVRKGEPGYGSVGVVVRMAGERGHALAIRSAAVAPRFGPVFDTCVGAALIGTSPVIASGSYELDVRMRLCIDPEGAP